MVLEKDSIIERLKRLDFSATRPWPPGVSHCDVVGSGLSVERGNPLDSRAQPKKKRESSST